MSCRARHKWPGMSRSAAAARRNTESSSPIENSATGHAGRGWMRGDRIRSEAGEDEGIAVLCWDSFVLSRHMANPTKVLACVAFELNSWWCSSGSVSLIRRLPANSKPIIPTHRGKSSVVTMLWNLKSLKSVAMPSSEIHWSARRAHLPSVTSDIAASGARFSGSPDHCCFKLSTTHVARAIFYRRCLEWRCRLACAGH